MPHSPPFRFSPRLPNSWVARAVRLVVCLVLLASMRAGTQNAPGQPHGTGIPQAGPRLTDPIGDAPATDGLEEEKVLRALNAARQKSMVADGDRLVRLVNELNAEIERTSPDSLSPAQLRKVAEIEKLAHNVKDKMSTSVRGLPAFEQPHYPHR
jgi:hypothetical protein